MKKWNDETIEMTLRSLLSDTGIFPSNTELQQMGRCDLSNAISKNGGFRYWAGKIGLDRAKSDSDFGWKGEEEFATLCEAQGLSARKSLGVKSPWDMVIESVLRVDVKNARYAEYGACCGWFYRTGKKLQADIAILFQDDTGDFYGLPWWICPTSNITISRNGGKYAAFKNNWPLIRRMLGIRMAEMAQISETRIPEVA